MQVTATPYSLYLQPENIELNGDKFNPVRPAFTELVPVNNAYIGSDFYFDDSELEDSIAYHLHNELSEKELSILKKKDGRKLKLDEILESNAIQGLRLAVINFLVGGAIRQLQNECTDEPLRKLSFLIHTEVAKAAHEWQKTIVDTLYDALREHAELNSSLFNSLIQTSYTDLSTSVKLNGDFLPSHDDVHSRVLDILEQEMLLVASVNSEQQVESMLDESGQLKLRAPLNIFIGGNILDRGITIGNLSGFYYGRRPNKFQQDTVLQHCRMFGYRPTQDLAITRFYTEQQIFNSMKRMHESDSALREQLSKSDDQSVVFIKGSSNGTVRPCSPNKIMLSNTTTLKPYKRLLPVGFQTTTKVKTRKITQQVDSMLSNILDNNDISQPFKINKIDALRIIDLVSEAIEMSEDEGYTYDWNGMKDAIKYMARNQDEIWCLWLRNRNNKRLAGVGSHTKYVATPDTAKTEGALAKKYATDVPMLTLFRQNGTEEQGWRGEAFYWPLIYAAGNVPVTIYSNDSNAYEE